MNMPLQFLFNLYFSRLQEVIKNVYFAFYVAHYQIQTVDFYWMDFRLVSILVFEM